MKKRNCLCSSYNLIWSGQAESNRPLKLGKSRPLQNARFTVLWLGAVKSCYSRLRGTFYFLAIMSFILIFALSDAHLHSFAANKVQNKVHYLQNESF